jgi:hypothetical protein
MPELVDFSGPWADDEKDQVRAAVQDAEGAGLPGAPEGKAPWVAICHRGGQRSVFGASRYRRPGVLSATTAADLAEHIRRAGAPLFPDE